MKKHTPGPRERAARQRRFIIRTALIGLTLVIFSVGIHAAYDSFSLSKDSRTTVGDTGISQSSAETSASASASSSTAIITALSDPAQTFVPSNTQTPTTQKASSSSSVSSQSTTSSASATVKPATADGGAPDLTGYVVVLDPGHQTHANSAQEALGPDMEGTKDKCSSGTAGVSTGRAEYKVNLEIGLRMRDYLESLGCVVYMTRTTNDVDISNIDRANFALSHSPDVYIRLHCDGSTNSSSRGIGVFAANSGKYSGSISEWGDLLGESLSKATGAKYRGCNASSTYSGLNWAASLPSFLLEMGYMSNAQDDELLSDPDYQQKICEGVADFVSGMPHISE